MQTSHQQSDCSGSLDSEPPVQQQSHTNNDHPISKNRDEWDDFICELEQIAHQSLKYGALSFMVWTAMWRFT